MRVPKLVSAAVAVLCVGLIGSQLALAGDGPAAAPKGKKKDKNAAVPAAPSGGLRAPDPGDVSWGGTKLDTVKRFTNAQGQSVYEISPSHFDLSAPLSEMAGSALTEAPGEIEAPENPQLPAWRTIRSKVPDPVVQILGEPKESALVPGPPPAAPVTGFNFVAVPINGGTPSDSNGAAGGNQYVETVNTRYQVWSLNRSTHVATSVLGPAAINTLWNGFGGPCQAQNSGDPIVVYDKLANRWLISQFTTTVSNGSYFQCVAISTTGNAAGTYNRWAFTVPNGVFGDYPKFGVWSDAYYMMAHGFQNTSGGYVAAIFAAMDRTKMLAADPNATWQVIFDPAEGGHMPADLDGFAPPPTGAPGIFLSLHDDGMWVYRMKVDFTTPANTVRTKQAIIPTAPFNAACGGGSCIPQPGTTVTVGSLADRLMFRAAYRNFVDHESIVISHSVDPSVTGVISGVRWYDFRLSGPPDPTCPTYPCVYQQGTISDTANGRSRWMPSIAMDGAENIVVGYSTTGTVNGTDNHTIRYTARAKADPPGTMTAPETILATGTANNTNSRWGDYTDMAVDPVDDCTLWYVNQYFLSAGSWSTQVASINFPNGSGPGQCAAGGCLNRPPSAPTIGTATVPGDNQLKVTWTGLVPAPGSYAIERAMGACGSEGMYQPVGAVSGSTTNYTDSSVLGGITYSYRVIAASDTGGKCQSLSVSACVSATATGTCNLKPSFVGAAAGSSNNQSKCGVNVSWTPVPSGCPLTPNVRYNIFRGTVPDFTPSIANRIATCVTGPSSYLDTDNLQSGNTYYYVVRAEDSSTGNGGECNGGNEDSNTAVASGTAYGAGTQVAPGTWTDGAGDGTAFLRLNVLSPGDTADQIWRFVKTSNDPGANHTPGGAYAYRNAGPGPGDTYLPNVCAEMQAPSLTAAASSVNLEYWERHDIEYHWDGLAIEYAVNGGPWTDVAPPSNDPGVGCDPADNTTAWEPMTCTLQSGSYINGCGYPDTKLAFNGPLASGTSCADWATSGAVTNYAHRCHPVTGLNPGDAIQFRWRFASDPGAEFAGFYLDDIAVTNVRVPNACVPDPCGGQPDGAPCNAGVACTSGDTCSGGVCQAGPVFPTPPEVAGLKVNGHSGTAVSWTSQGGASTYDVVSSLLSDMRINGTTTATCLANDQTSATIIDGRANPSAGDGYYYLVRAQSTCGSGGYGVDSSGTPRSPSAGCP